MMTAYSSSKLAVKDSFDDEDVSDDVEDEVFIRDGRNGFKVDDEMGVKRPLMAPRRKHKNTFHPETTKRSFYKRFCVQYCYGIIAVALIFGLVMGATIFLNLFPSPLYNFRLWSLGTGKRELAIIPCTDFSATDIWYKTFPKLKSEAALVLNDLTHDGVDDIIIGYSTGIDESSMPSSCEEFIGSKGVCGGGVLALEGNTGDVIWQHWAKKDILFVDCSANINSDKTKDCLISGKEGVLSIIDGQTGTVVWELAQSSVPHIIDVYSAQYISDLDGDGYSDVLAAHTSALSGQLMILNGRSGQIIGQLDAPDKAGVFTAPRVSVAKDGTDILLFATGSFDSGGTLYATPLTSVAVGAGSQRCTNIWQSDISVSSGIVLADMNGDGTEDVILTSGDTLTVLDGSDYSSLWNVSSSEFNQDQRQILIGPTPAYFDDDLIPDLLITHMIGPSFPTYYYSQTWIASGKDGVGLLAEPIMGGSEVTAPGVTVSFTGIGNDMFLFWMTTCNSQSQQKKPFLFARQTTVHEKAHADLCHLRFNKSLEIQMYVLNQHIKPPGILLYSSKLRWAIEHNSTESKVEAQSSIKLPTRNWADKESIQFNEQAKGSDKNIPEIPKSFLMYDAGEDRNIMNNLPRFQPEHLDTLPETRESLGNLMLPIGINLDEMAKDYEPIYPQEVESDDLLIPGRVGMRRGNVLGGRDERAEFKRKREKRNTQRESGNTLPRATTTAALSKPLSGNGIDIVFASHWEMPASNVYILTERDQRCIRKRVSAAQQSNNLNDLLEMIEERAEWECLGINRTSSLGDNEDTLKRPTDGQLTVYRINLSCNCSNIDPTREQCSTPLPIEQQSYSHRAGDVYFKRRRTNAP